MRLPQFIIFCLVGVLNTAVDLGLYTILRHEGLTLLAANTISATAALLVSYALNRRFTFRVVGQGRKTFILFLVVTLAGIWAVQPLVIYATETLLTNPSFAGWLSGLVVMSTATVNVVSKLAGTPATLLWNYVMYSRVVFIDRRTPVA